MLIYIPTLRGAYKSDREAEKVEGMKRKRVFMSELKPHLKPLDAGCSFLTGIRANHTTPSLMQARNNISKVV